ncbi:MAG: UDP-N-acetylmuramate dehydrogenase [Synergistaceae bacterium]|nr:UDP-N-acetylmuramate dehydrogenase [Synergistaceae bacterium]
MDTLNKLNIIEKGRNLASLCTLGVGGIAEFFAEPDSLEGVQELIKLAKGYPVYVLGGGSNVIYPDDLIHGLVISTRNINKITWHDDLSADIESGYKLPGLVKNIREKNLAGLEFAAGIPGSLGGAVSGNAGAGGHGVCELIESVLAIDSSGNFRKYNNKDFSFEYRKCSLSCENIIILSVKMKFRASRPEDEEIYQKFLSLRKNQPLNFKSAGCTFKNPEGYSAGKLLDDCGCKNLRVGGAVVSDRHANFILNTGNASSFDIMDLIKICRDKVYGITGIMLEQEIKNAEPCFIAS